MLIYNTLKSSTFLQPWAYLLGTPSVKVTHVWVCEYVFGSSIWAVCVGRWPSGLIDGSRLFAQRQSWLWVERDSRRDGEIQSNLFARQTLTLHGCWVLSSTPQNNPHEPESYTVTERDCNKELIRQAPKWLHHSFGYNAVRNHMYVW